MIPEKYWRAFAANVASMLDDVSIDDVFKSEIFANSIDGSPERLINDMNEAGIDKSVVFGVDWGLALGEPKISIEAFNKYIANACKNYPDRLIGFFTIDPRRKKAVDLFEKAIIKWDMKGLKLHPTTGYFLNGTEARDLFKKAEELSVPVISHLGYIISLKGYLARPHYFDEISSDFPELRISLAHMNYGEVDDLLNLMFCKANVFCDISAHGQILTLYSPADFYRQLKYFMNFSGVQDKTMFGSDWPMVTNIMSLKNWVNTIKDLRNDEISKILDNYGYENFFSSDIENILGRNAQRFLKDIV